MISARTTLGTIARIDRVALAPSQMRNGTPYVGLDNIDGKFGDLTPGVARLGRIRSSKFVFSSKHLLYGKLRPYLHKVGRPEFDGICSTDILPISPGPTVNRGYLFHFLRSPEITQFATMRSVGVNLPRISPATLLAYPISLPPMHEQRRVAEILDHAINIRRAAGQMSADLDKLVRSTFLEMFGDSAADQKGWSVLPLGELAIVRRGASPRPIQKFLGGDIPWVKIGDATGSSDLHITRTEEFVTDEGAARSVVLEPGSVIIANSGVSLGFGRILDIRGCIHDGWLSVERLDDRVNKLYLVSLINSMTSRLRATAPSGTQPNLNTTIARSLRIPIPPPDMQQRFVEVLERTTAAAGRLHAAEQTADDLAAALVQEMLRDSTT